jgi:hypothetical protein
VKRHPTLADRFRRAGTTVIDLRGEPAYAVVEIDLPGSATIEVRRLRAVAAVVQALRLEVVGGVLETGGASARSLVLHADTSPPTATLRAELGQPGRLTVWNEWFADGADQAWLGNAAMRHEVDGTRHRFTCSDGIGPVSFGDLVVELTITPDAEPGPSGTVGAS